MGNYFILSALFSILGLKRKEDETPTPKQEKSQQKQQIISSKQQPEKNITLKKKQKEIELREEQKIQEDIPSIKIDSNVQNKNRKQENVSQIKEPVPQSVINMQDQVKTFILMTKDNYNIFYHNPMNRKKQSLQSRSNQNEALDELFDKNNQKLDGKSKNQKPQVLSLKSAVQIKQLGCAHSVLMNEGQVKQKVYKTKILFFIKEGINDFKQKNLSRLGEIFDLHIVDDRDQLAEVLGKMGEHVEEYPVNLLCHYSLFQKLHKEHVNDKRVSKISVYNSSFMSTEPTPQLLQHDECNKLKINENLSLSKKYAKLGIVDTKLFDIRQNVIKLNVAQQIKGQIQPLFSQFRYLNDQHINPKQFGLRSCLLMQQFNRETLLTLNYDNLTEQKLKAKLDLIKYVESILGIEFYRQYVGSLLRNQPNWIDNKTKEQTKTLFNKIQELLKPIKEYKIVGFYQNFSQIDKESIRTLEELEQLKLLPVTDSLVFWEAIDRFLFPKNSTEFVFKLIYNALTHAKSPMEIQYMRLFVSDVFMAIRQLYKLYNQSKYEGECYYAVNLCQSQLDHLLNRLPTQNHNKRSNKLKIDRRMKIIQNQNFIIASKNKQKQIQKDGNVLFEISIRNMQRFYDCDYGFIQKQKCHIKLDKKGNERGRNVNISKTASQDDEKIVFNILNTFCIESVVYDTAYEKYIVRLGYGYVPTVIKKLVDDPMYLQLRERIVAECYMNNVKNYHRKIKSQGDALYFSQLYDQSILFFQEFLLKARKEPQVNLPKIAYICMGQYRSYLKKKLYHRAQDELSRALTTVQKIFGQKCHQMWEHVILQTQIYQEQGYFERGIQRLSTLLSLIKNKAFELQRKPNDWMEENLTRLQQLEAEVNMRMGRLYMKMNKQQLAQNYLKKSLEIAVRSIGQFHPLTAQIYSVRRVFYIKYQVYEKAVFDAKKALAIQLNIHGQDHIQTATTYYEAGEAFQKNEQYQMAFKSYQSSLNIFEEFYSQDHQKIIQLYKLIGTTLHSKGSYKQAIKYFEQSLKLASIKYGISTLICNQLYFLIGKSYKNAGDYINAIEHFQKSNSLSKNLISQNHDASVKNLIEMAEIFQSQGKFEKAIQFYEKPLLSLIRNKGKWNKEVVWYYEKIGNIHMNLSKSYQNLDQNKAKQHLDKALDYFRRVVQVRFSLGKNTYETSSSLDNIGKAYLIKNDHKHALSYFQQSYTIKKLLIQNKIQNAEQESLQFSITFFLMGWAYLVAKQYPKSIQFFQKSLKIKLKKLSQSHPQVSQIYRRLGQNYTKLQDYKKAQQYLKKTLSIYLSLYGSSHPQTSLIHFMIGCMYFEKGQILDKAMDYIVKSIETINDLGLSSQHQYFIKYKIRLLEILNFLLTRMVQKQIPKEKIHYELKSIYFHLKKLDDCKDMKDILTIKKNSPNQMFNQLFRLFIKLEQKLLQKKFISKPSKNLDAASILANNEIKKEQRNLGEVLKSLITQLEMK